MRLRKSALAMLAAALLGTVFCLPARAQTQAPLSADEIAAQIKPMHPKTVVFVFDVTASTKSNGVFGNERAATATILRDGCEPGDRVVLENFDTEYNTAFDQVLTQPSDVDGLIEKLATDVSKTHGTNIRLPHHEALRIVAHDLPHDGVIVLLTDSFNDQPLPADSSYPDYTAYYNIYSLTKYPDTQANRDYERLLNRLLATGKLHQYGVGIGIAENGRPIERLPQTATESDAYLSARPAVSTPTPPAPKTSVQTILGIVLALIVAALGLGVFLANRPMRLRLRIGDKGTPRDYSIRPGDKVNLGGSLTTAAPGDDVFPLGRTAGAVAAIKANRGGIMTLVPGNSVSGATVYHNGAALEDAALIRAGDEIRVAVPEDGSGVKEYRVQVLDPKE